MKNILFCFFFAFVSNTGFGLNQFYKTDPTTSYQAISKKQPKQSFHTLKNKLEIQFGRQLSFKEKTALRIQVFLSPFKKDAERKANNLAVVGFVLSVTGWVVLWPLLIAGLIASNGALKNERIYPGILTNRNYKLAKAGRILSVIGLFIMAIALIIIITNGGFGGYY